MAFTQGLSGLNTSSRALDVISNNIANTSTVGFKSSRAVFADVYAGAMTGVNTSLQIGYGSKITAVYQSFIDGMPTTTSNPLDMAIIGNGFYVIERFDGSIAYTRNGQFDINKDGYLITPTGEKVLGVRADINGNIPPSGGLNEPLFVPQGDSDPKPSDRVEIRSGNLNAADAVPTNPTFNRADFDSFNFMHTIPVYDSLGGVHQLSIYFVKVSDGLWDAHVMIEDDDSMAPPTPATVTTHQLAFTTSGKPGDPATPGAPPYDPLNLTTNPIVFLHNATLSNGAANLSIDIDLSNLNQFGSRFSVTDHWQNGYTVGQIAGIVVTQDGVIQGRYTNGQTKDLGQVVLATFRSNQGLARVGDNMWVESAESGPPIVGRPRSGLNGLISGGQVEESNVDLTQELVNMIIQQRNYQANAQTIRTQDQIMQTLVNLR